MPTYAAAIASTLESNGIAHLVTQETVDGLVVYYRKEFGFAVNLYRYDAIYADSEMPDYILDAMQGRFNRWACRMKEDQSEAAKLRAIGKLPADTIADWKGGSGLVTRDYCVELRHVNRAIQNRICDILTDSCIEIDGKAYANPSDESLQTQLAFIRHWRTYQNRVLNMFQFAPAIENPQLMAFYESRAKYDAQRRTSAKPARAIKRAFPFLTETQCNAFAVWYKEEMTPVEYTICQGKTRESFYHAYCYDQSRANDVNYSLVPHDIKSLSSSCMRHTPDYWGLRAHPAESYASGDFKVIFAQDANGGIAARVVVCIAKGKYIPAPIYSLSDSATQLIWDTLLSEGFDVDSYDPTFQGAKVAKIDAGNGKYLMPYHDLDSEAEDYGDYFRIGSGGIDIRTTSGSVYPEPEAYCQCEACGCDCDEDSTYYGGDMSLCESCYDNRFEPCNCCNDICEIASMQPVYTSRYSSHNVCQSCLGNGDYVYCDNSGEYSHIDDTIYVDCESVFVQTWEADRYTRSDKSNEYFPNEQILTLPNGENWTHNEIKEEGHFDIVKTWSDERLESVYTLTLKTYLELDHKGDVINRQLDLELEAA